MLLPHIEDSCGHHLSDGENYHGGPRQIEQCVEDPFLDVFVSFHWIDILDEKFVKLVTDWTNGSYTNGSRSTPNYIIIGTKNICSRQYPLIILYYLIIVLLFDFLIYGK